eukprot:scaffold66832_cov48-Phaeocystis_antarctica.AAC.2
MCTSSTTPPSTTIVYRSRWRCVGVGGEARRTVATLTMPMPTLWLYSLCPCLPDHTFGGRAVRCRPSPRVAPPCTERWQNLARVTSTWVAGQVD